MEASLQFYCEILGFEKAFEIRDDKNNPWIEYIKVAPGQFIELFYGGLHKAEETSRQIGFNHLCLEVENIHKLADELKAKGVTLDAEPKQAKDGNYQCWIKDPDGTRIELMQIEPDSPQRNS